MVVHVESLPVDASLASPSATHDSMVTVRLSGPPILSVDTSAPDLAKHATAAQAGRDVLSAYPSIVTEQEICPVAKIDEADHDLEYGVVANASLLKVGRATESKRASISTHPDVDPVNWEQLEKTEEQEPRTQCSDESTAMLLARLEQENSLLAKNPKSGVKDCKTASQPPSLHQLEKMITDPSPSELGYSIILSVPPPPMTDLEFYAALVQDYSRTAQCLPTLLSKKIRGGIPPPLRGVVWQSICGARDKTLEDEYDRLGGETSPYEGIIGKDLGRSFPGVEMFRDAAGDGQQMLGRVLKRFSLHDTKIGYCQGLAFLVGPLLMHMGEKEAFCVLVRLMEHYDLRSTFLPDLAGLHIRIHQFRMLLKQHLPLLSVHLEKLQIELAYVSQWFLSFFAVTCPLPMLFRIYDVIFAEGATETIMRVALALMRRNEARLTACTEFEDAMQLLLSRGLWDCYNYNADDFVNDFSSITVTHEELEALHKTYRESQALDTSLLTDVGSAASRFLGRLWVSKSAATNSSPTPLRPAVKRTPSKQSIASTLNSAEGDSMFSRDSSNTDDSSISTQSFKPNKDKNLHSQIEDLLTALSELQRDHALLAAQLQSEREDREMDGSAVRSLLAALRKRANAAELEEESTITTNDLSGLLTSVEDRFEVVGHGRSVRTNDQVNSSLTTSKHSLSGSSQLTQELMQKIAEQQQQLRILEHEVRDGHTQIRNGQIERRRLEKQVLDLQSRSPDSTPDSMRGDDDWQRSSPARSAVGGLREFKLGRQNSTTTQSRPNLSLSKRTSSMASSSPQISAEEHDVLVAELVQCKTAEAVARQEANEANAKLEALRKMFLSPPSTPSGVSSLSSSPRNSDTSMNTNANAPTTLQPLVVNNKATSSTGSTGEGGVSGLGIAGGINLGASRLAGTFWGGMSYGWGKKAAISNSSRT